MKHILPSVKFLGMVSLMFLVSITIVACGGGGEDSLGVSNAPITSNRTYFIEDDGSYEPGYRLQFNLSGSSNTRDTITGTLSISTKNKILVDGNLVIPVERLLNLSNLDEGSSITSFTTTYYDANHRSFLKIESTQGITCTPTQTVYEPSIAMIGDFGQLTPWACDDGTSSSGTWLLEPGPGTYAIYTATSIVKDSFGDIEATEIDYLTIDESGDPKSLRIEIYFEGGITMVLDGVRVIK